MQNRTSVAFSDYPYIPKAIYFCKLCLELVDNNVTVYYYYDFTTVRCKLRSYIYDDIGIIHNKIPCIYYVRTSALSEYGISNFGKVQP